MPISPVITPALQRRSGVAMGMGAGRAGEACVMVVVAHPA